MILISGFFPPVLGGRRDSETGRVRILYIGDGWGPSPVPKFQVDPAFTVMSVPTSELHTGSAHTFDNRKMKKFVRLYMPRTFEALVSDYDFIVLSDANIIFMGHNHVKWIEDAVRDVGLGLAMIGGMESFGAPRGQPWTPLEDVLPVNFNMGPWVYTSFKVRPAIEHPFTQSLPWESIPFFHGTNKITLKNAATQLLTSDEISYPPLSYMEFGEGRSVAHSSDWTPGGASDVRKWKYYPDYVANIAFLATRNEIPQDAQLLRGLRTSFWTTAASLSSVVDTINFVERFGANIRPVEEEIGEVRAMIGRAESLYIEQDYDGSREKLQGIERRIAELNEMAMELKDRALFWIYLIEWAVTTGVGLAAGVALWTLMIRKSLYREVGSTHYDTE